MGTMRRGRRARDLFIMGFRGGRWGGGEGGARQRTMRLPTPRLGFPPRGSCAGGAMVSACPCCVGRMAQKVSQFCSVDGWTISKGTGGHEETGQNIQRAFLAPRAVFKKNEKRRGDGTRAAPQHSSTRLEKNRGRGGEVGGEEQEATKDTGLLLTGALGSGRLPFCNGFYT